MLCVVRYTRCYEILIFDLSLKHAKIGFNHVILIIFVSFLKPTNNWTTIIAMDYSMY